MPPTSADAGLDVSLTPVASDAWRIDVSRPDAGPPPPVCGAVPAPWDLGTGHFATGLGPRGVSGAHGSGDTAIHDALWRDGELFVVGDFTHAGPIRAFNVAAWTEDGGWRAMGDGVNEPLRSIAMTPSGTLYVASVGSVYRQADGAWAQIGATGSGISTLIAEGEALLAGGAFRRIDGVEVAGLARWHEEAWTAVAFPGRTVDATFSDASGTCIGGRADPLAGYVACRPSSEEAWESVELPRQPGPPYPAPVTSIGRDASGRLLVGGGAVLGDDAMAPSGVLRWTGASWEVVGAGLSTGIAGQPIVSTLLATREVRTGDDVIWAGGWLLGAIGSAAAPEGYLGGVGRFRAGRWGAPGFIDGWAGSIDIARIVAADSGDVMIVGAFDQVHGTRDDVLAPHGVVHFRQADQRWHALEHPGDDARGIGGGYVIAARGGCGPFIVPLRDIVRDGAIQGVGRLDPDDVLHPLHPGVEFESRPAALAIGDDGTVYVGGGMAIAGVTRPLLRVVDGRVEPIGPLGGTTWPRVSDYVEALALDGDVLYVGGSFEDDEEPSRSHLARWDGSTWTAVGSRDARFVSELLVHDDVLYAVERTDGPMPRYWVTRWDGTSWTELGESFEFPVGSPVWFRGSLVIGTDGLDGMPVRRWSGAEWVGVGDAMALSEFGPSVYSLAVSGETLIAGGSFTAPTGARVGALYLDDMQWRVLGDGIDGFVFDVAVDRRGIHFVGEFERAGSVPSWGYARLEP